MARSKAPADRQKFYFQFITTPTADTQGTALVLHFDSQRYFIGQLAEGTQRACIQRGVGLKKVRNMFLTGNTSWQNIGGLVGMILTMSDVQAEEREVLRDGTATGRRPRINIHGGPKLMHAMACSRRFVFRTGMPLSVHETRPNGRDWLEPCHQDENITAWGIPISKSASGPISPVEKKGRSQSQTTVDREQALRKKTVNDMFDSDWRKDKLFEERFDQVKLPAMVWQRDPTTKELKSFRCTTMEDAPHLTPDSIVLIRNPWPAATVEELPPADNISSSTALSYVMCGQPQRGKFQPEKAKELGVFGPDRAKLTSGESVTLANGTVITPEMVLSETEPGRAFAVFDVPSSEYLEDLISKIETLRENQILLGLQSVVWLLGSGIVHSAEFKSLVALMPEAQHLVASPDVGANYIAYDSSAASSIRLAQICPDVFLEPMYNNGIPNTEKSIPDVTFAQRGMIQQISPTSQVDTSEVPSLLDVDAAKDSEGFKELIPSSLPQTTATPFDDIEIITLGTGSAVPSKYRNVSATLVRIPGLGSYLFDCGENTLGQLRRSYSAEELNAILCDLRMIWISHLHADHHLGIMTIILAQEEAIRNSGLDQSESKLYMISESTMAKYLVDYSSIESSSSCVLLSVYRSQLEQDGNAISIDSLPIGIKTLDTVPVSHCHGAQAVSVTFSNGFKFSYSGDCRPSLAFAKIGQGSHVLLHEATFDDGLEGDAMAKKHCTTGEAMGVAVAMQAKNVVLTHFSQRYQKLPVLTSIKFDDKINFEEGGQDDVEAEHENMSSAMNDNAAPVESSDTVDAGAGNDGALTQGQSNSALFSAVASMDMNICVAFDLMRIKYSQIPSMHLFYPAVERMFELEYQKNEVKREQAAAINQKRISAKQDRTDSSKKKTKKEKNDGDTKSFYDTINRPHTSKASKGQGGAILQPSDTTDKNNTAALNITQDHSMSIPVPTSDATSNATATATAAPTAESEPRNVQGTSTSKKALKRQRLKDTSDISPLREMEKRRRQ